MEAVAAAEAGKAGGVWRVHGAAPEIGAEDEPTIRFIALRLLERARSKKQGARSRAKEKGKERDHGQL